MGDANLNREAERVEMPRGVNGRAFVRWRSLMKLLKPVLKKLHISAEGIDVQELGDGGIHLKGEGGSDLPKHPWQLYRATSEETSGWAVYGATVNGTHQPTLEGEGNIFNEPPPLLPDDVPSFSVYLEFDMTGSSWQASDGKYYLLSGSQVLSGVNVTTSPGAVSPIEANPDTGEITDGHYVYLVAVVTGGKVTAQPMRFSVNYSICSGGSLQISAYG